MSANDHYTLIQMCTYVMYVNLLEIDTCLIFHLPLPFGRSKKEAASDKRLSIAVLRVFSY